MFSHFWGIFYVFLKGSYNTLSISQCFLADDFRFWQLRPLNGGHLGFFNGVLTKNVLQNAQLHNLKNFFKNFDY